jgi:hypothetical protein
MLVLFLQLLDVRLGFTFYLFALSFDRIDFLIGNWFGAKHTFFAL